jgi:hypothetical protein
MASSICSATAWTASPLVTMVITMAASEMAVATSFATETPAASKLFRTVRVAVPDRHPVTGV